MRRSVRRERQIRSRFDHDGVEVLVGWGTASVEEFLEAHPEYDTRRRRGQRLEGEILDK